MKKFLTVILAIIMIIPSTMILCYAESTTTLTTTVPGATYTLNIPANQEITFGATETNIGNVTVTDSNGFAEGKNLLDSLVMVSNAFTSNGYAVLGDTPIGKLNSLFLVWGGYILSGVGTATLTTALLSRHFNKRFEELEELIKNNNDENADDLKKDD